MPRADAGVVKYWLQDHDTDVETQSPPVQNTWYEVFHAYDVRLLWCVVYQSNDEVAAKDLEVRWTIDGNVYLGSANLANATLNRIFRGHQPSAVGTAGLTFDAGVRTAAYYVDKRGLDFKVEVRITDPVGTNQVLSCWCVRETLELT